MAVSLDGNIVVVETRWTERIPSQEQTASIRKGAKVEVGRAMTNHDWIWDAFVDFALDEAVRARIESFLYI